MTRTAGIYYVTAVVAGFVVVVTSGPWWLAVAGLALSWGASAQLLRDGPEPETRP